jgi:hypothetical protein
VPDTTTPAAVDETIAQISRVRMRQNTQAPHSLLAPSSRYRLAPLIYFLRGSN